MPTPKLHPCYQCLSVLVPMATGDGNDNVGNFQNVVQLCSWSASSGRLQLVAMFRLAACSNQAAVVNCCATKPIQSYRRKDFFEIHARFRFACM